MGWWLDVPCFNAGNAEWFTNWTMGRLAAHPGDHDTCRLAVSTL